jgi:hypothetical protein
LVGLHTYSNSRDRKGDTYRNSSCRATPTATGIQAGRQRQCLQQFQKRLPTTATPAGTGFQQRQQEEEFKERLLATATEKGIQASLTDETEMGRRVLVLGFHARIHREIASLCWDFTLEFIMRLRPRNAVASSQWNFILVLGFHGRIHSRIASS